MKEGACVMSRYEKTADRFESRASYAGRSLISIVAGAGSASGLTSILVANQTHYQCRVPVLIIAWYRIFL